MNGTERRAEIYKTLVMRKHDTITHLAEEFGVSRRTLRRDVEILSLDKPIYTRAGRYGGGVYLLDARSRVRAEPTMKQISVLKKLLHCVENNAICQLTIDEQEILWTLITQCT